MQLSGRPLSQTDNRTINTLLHTIGDFERISDHSVNMLDTAAEIRDFGASSDAYAEVGRNGGLTLNDPAKSDKSDPDNSVYNKRFTITSETMVLVAYMKDNNVDIDTVEVGDIGDINQPVNGVPTADTSAVYVLNVDDIDETAPVAKLILVVLPALYHGDMARKMAPYLKDGQVVILNPHAPWGRWSSERCWMTVM